MSSARIGTRRKRLAAGLMGVFALAPHSAPGTTRVVTICDDSGSGSLRQQVSIAQSGDTIDLSTAQLACSLITLNAGEILVPQQDLTLTGPDSRTVTINVSSNLVGRLLHHTDSSGTLSVYNLTLMGGYYSSYSNNAKGGCIASSGNVRLTGVTVTGCTAFTYYGAYAQGGAIYSGGHARLYQSRVVGNNAIAVANAALGGGIFAAALNMHESTISGNSAVTTSGRSLGGGAYVGSLGTFVYYSTIDSNSAQHVGGLFQEKFGQAVIQQSTISGNRASLAIGGMLSMANTTRIYGSTIAFNSAPNYAGIYATGAVYANSSILARNMNTSPGGFADLYVKGAASITGQANLIVSYNHEPAAGVITVTADPQLTPLADHGGPTRTHALQATSPAIDAGDPITLNATTDQRGLPRVVNGVRDIGAYERQVNDDEIFYSGFD